MKVSYTSEQRARAIRVYNETKSYAKTIRILGYPSHHVLFDWVRKPKPRRKSAKRCCPARRYGWRLKALAVEKVSSGEDIRGVAIELGVINYATIYEWLRKWRTEGNVEASGRRVR